MGFGDMPKLNRETDAPVPTSGSSVNTESISSIPEVLSNKSFWDWLKKKDMAINANSRLEDVVDMYVSENHIICMPEEKEEMSKRLNTEYYDSQEFLQRQ